MILVNQLFAYTDSVKGNWIAKVVSIEQDELELEIVTDEGSTTGLMLLSELEAGLVSKEFFIIGMCHGE